MTMIKINTRYYENITAGYGEAKLSLPILDAVGGVRVERTQQGYTSKYILSDRNQRA